MRVMTYNIRLGIQQGLGPVAEVIRSRDPDVIALQEVGRHWTMGPTGDTTRELSELTGLPHHAFAPSLDGFPPAQYGHALLSRWPIEAPRVEWLPRSVDEPRTLMTCTILAPDGPIRVFSTHLSHVGDRRLQSPVILTRVRDALADGGPPFVVTGDFNELPEDPWIAEVQELLRDADAEASRPTFPAAAPSRRIDYLFASAGRWEDVEIVDDAVASDHRPLVATWRS